MSRSASLPPRYAHRTLWTLLAIFLSPLAAYADPVFFESKLQKILFLQDYNTRIVVIGTSILGAACGLSGTFLLLRKRALMGDVLSHTMLPGVVLAFLLGTTFGYEKTLPLLLLGAAIAAGLGSLSVLMLRRISVLGDETAMAIVLSFFFGIGTVLLSIAQESATGHQAGLESFIYGKTASLTRGDVQWILLGSLFSLGLVLLLFKEFRMLCFDEEFTGCQGRPVVGLDAALFAVVIVTTLVGLQAVGLILIIALLVIPPAAARFWTDQLHHTTAVAATIGALGCWSGVTISALAPRLPAGALIVLSTAFLFLISLLFGSRRGLIGRLIRWSDTRASVGKDHLLRAFYELSESHLKWIRLEDLAGLRSWTPRQLQRLLKRARKRGEVIRGNANTWKLTDRGHLLAAHRTRNHRLWELYLIRYAHLATSHVDRAADRIEHVLGPELVHHLEQELDQRPPYAPESPHPILNPEESR
ncbi:MAG: metal ABC transporter permease [Planctomycetota bacterium]|nr:metal ABC transporter permease [Planctomycetota bacterium]